MSLISALPQYTPQTGKYIFESRFYTIGQLTKSGLACTIQQILLSFFSHHICNGLFQVTPETTRKSKVLYAKQIFLPKDIAREDVPHKIIAILTNFLSAKSSQKL
ncbi:hypothetical protein HAX54_008073 [Datura stramonium]|uniref:Uncharacterized protein n=1 Tax=Datura stramonium TaxID=4076 RepID=A0ABS8WY79_DATST|nr:hypothetical protein [Datura stramonium]